MNQSAPAARNIAIDNLRTCMMGVVMFGHALLPYLTAPRRFEDPQTHIGFDVIGVFLYAFAMQAFFVTAGFAAAGLYTRRGSRMFWRNRFSRIFLPLLLGYVLLTPLTRAAYLFAQAAADSASLAVGWEVLSQRDWLRWGKVYHLWFLASLLVFSAGALAIRAGAHRLPNTLRDAVRRVSSAILVGPHRTAWLLVLIGSISIPAYVGGTGQGTDGWIQLSLFVFFALGWLLYQHREGLARDTQHWWYGPAISIACLPVCAWATLHRLRHEDQTDWLIGTIAGASNAVIAVGMTLGLIGAFLRYGNSRGRFAQYASDASYWVYLVHYPIVIAVGGVFSVFAANPVLKYLGVVSMALPLILGSYEVLVRRGPLRPVLGPKLKKPASTASS